MFLTTFTRFFSTCLFAVLAFVALPLRAEVNRFTIEFPAGTLRSETSRINVDMLDSTTEDLLIHMVFDGPFSVYLDTTEMKKIDRLENQKLRISFEANRTSVTGSNSHWGALEYIELSSPVSDEVVLKFTNLKEPRIFKGKHSSEKIANEAYKATKGSVNKVFEAGNLPQPFQTFFANRDIESFKLVSSFSGGSSYSYTPPLNSPADIVLSEGFNDSGARQIIWDMINQPEKPTLAQFLAAFKDIPGHPLANQVSSSLETNLRGVAKKIAQLEKVYPGATWYGLGRDIFLDTDAIDAFYTFIGQPGRVKRLHASAQSFPDNTEYGNLLVVDFLRTNGIDLEKIDSMPSQIIFDTTSYGNGRGDGWRLSQSRHLMGAAYWYWTTVLKRDAADLFKKLNFVAVNFEPRHTPLVASLDVKSFFRGLKNDFGPTPILTLNDASLAYCKEWHPWFKMMKRKGNEEVVTTHEQNGALSTRVQMLAELFSIRQTIMTPQFVGSVLAQSRNFGVEWLAPASTSTKQSGDSCENGFEG